MNQRPPQDLQIPFDRVTYRDGQLLASRDMQDDVRTDQRLRSLHTRYLHDTWGIALGFTVTGAAGGTSLHVGPGYAIDALAQELLLAEDLDLPVPNTPSQAELVLAMNYPPSAAFRGRPELSAVCLGGGLDPRNERPLFAWRTFEELNMGADVPLAKVTVQQGALLTAPDLEVRKNATRIIRPHMGFGTMEFTPPRDTLLGQVQVDTSDAGFAGVPNYFATLTSPNSKAPALFLAYVNAFSFIDRATPSSFFFNMPFSFLLRGLETVSLSWLGIEAVTGCEPVPSLFFVFTLAGLMSTSAIRIQENIR
jgi:hypothetical protein